MKSAVLILYLIVVNLGCFCSEKEKQIQFYYRRVGIENSNRTYVDEFKLTSYQNNSIFAKDLYAFAKRYVDSVHADLPIYDVAFVGQLPCEELPEDPVEDPKNLEKDRFIIAFGFDNPQSGVQTKTSPELYTITVSLDGKKNKVYYLKFPDGKRVIDSVLNSSKPLNTDF